MKAKRVILSIINTAFPGLIFLLRKQYRLSFLFYGIFLAASFLIRALITRGIYPVETIGIIFNTVLFIFSLILLKQPVKIKLTWKNSLLSLLWAGFFILTMWFHMQKPFVFDIKSNNMFPALTPGDKVIFSPRKDESFKRFDIIAFENEETSIRLDMPKGSLFISRIIGLPGETIKIENKRIYINDQELDDPYAHFDSSLYELFPSSDIMKKRAENYSLITIPPDHYFLIGDNRYNSNDSRYFGPVHRTNIKSVMDTIKKQSPSTDDSKCPR